MRTILTNLPELGQLVHVRSRSWVVSDVLAGSVLERPESGPSRAVQHFVSLASVEDDALGEELQVVWELEPGASIVEKVTLPEPHGFDSPDRLDAFLNSVRWGASSTADLRHIQSPFRAGIELEDYQLDPVVRAIQMPRANLLIADDVGLGKTIEAGLVALELLIRHRARKILIICPASLQVQWQEQMRDKFGLDFRIVDRELMRTLRRQRGIHANPWSHFPRLITSIDFLKRERPLRLFKEVLPGAGEPVYPRRFDLLILDEAHNCAPSGRGQYATDSLRTQAIRTLTPHFEHRLFLTATPHNGYRESFTALLELLDDQRFARTTTPDPTQLRAVMVRRMKKDLPPTWDGKPRFPERKLEHIEVRYTVEEKAVHQALKDYTEHRLKNVSGAAERLATEFVLKTLKKRLFSSPASFQQTLEKHVAAVSEGHQRKTNNSQTANFLQREIDRVDEEYGDDAELEAATDDTLETASTLLAKPDQQELRLLKQMQEWADKATAKGDSKLNELVNWLETTLRKNKQWTDERVILFTEYRATMNWLLDKLSPHGFTKSNRLLTMFGGMDLDKRSEVKAAFQASPKESEVRILLATDAAAEGLDLQNHCYRVIHYEIPWNPNRLEQRNGRIDRHGQPGFLAKDGKRYVFAYHFVGEGFGKEAGSGKAAADMNADLEFLMRVAQKVDTIREDLGSYGNVLAADLEQAMLKGNYSMPSTKSAEDRVEPTRKLFKFEQDLKKRVEELMQLLRETRQEQHLTPEAIKKVVEVSLEIAEQPPLLPGPRELGEGIYIMPPLKGSWAACGEGLVHPFTQAVRPITFDHGVAKNRDDVVLVHLNHRLVQMSLRLLRSRIWSDQSSKALHRVSCRCVPDNMLDNPAVIAFARLVVIGGDTHRLHEEIITSGGVLRDGRFNRMNVGEVEKLLAAGDDKTPSEAMQKSLLGMWSKVDAPLRQSLEARMKDRKDGLQAKLTERAEKESNDIRLVMTELQKSIERELQDPEYKQMTLFNEPERQQFERNRDYLRARIQAIPGEIERETAAIKARYSDLQPRMFPVAVTYFVPRRLA